MVEEIQYTEYVDPEAGYLDHASKVMNMLLDNYYIPKALASGLQPDQCNFATMPAEMRALLNDSNHDYKAGMSSAKGKLREIVFKNILDITNPDPDRYLIRFSSEDIDQNNGCDIIVYDNGQAILGFDMKGKNFDRDLKKSVQIQQRHQRRQQRQGSLDFPVRTITADMGPFGMNRLLQLTNDFNSGNPTLDYNVRNIVTAGIANCKNGKQYAQDQSTRLVSQLDPYGEEDLQISEYLGHMSVILNQE